MSLASLSEIDVDAKGEKGNQLEVRLYDSKGKLEEVLLGTFDPNGDATVQTTKLSSAVRGTYKLVAKVIETGETSELTVNVLSNVAKVTVEFDDVEIDVDNTFTSASPDFEVSYDTNLISDLKDSDFTVVGVDGTKVLSKVYANGELTIVFQSEDGTETLTEKVEIDNAAIDYSASTITPDATDNKVVKIKLVDTLGEKVTTLKQANFGLDATTFSGIAIVDVTRDDNVYTVTADGDISAAASVALGTAPVIVEIN